MTQGCGIGACGLAPIVLATTPVCGTIPQPAGCLRSRCARPLLVLVLIAFPPALLAADDSFASSPPSAFVQGVAAYQRGDWQRAANEFTAYLAQPPASNSRRDAQFYLAEVLVQLGNYADAHRHYFEYVRQIDNDPPAMVIRARFRLGETSYLLAEHERAERELRAFTAQYPDDALASRANDYLSTLAATRGATVVKQPDPEVRQPGDPLVAIQAAIRQADHHRVIALVDELLESSESIDDDLRRQAAAIGFRQWLALGDERRAIDTYLRCVPSDVPTAESELDLRQEVAAALESTGHGRAATRERARCQQIGLGHLKTTGERTAMQLESPERNLDSRS